MCDVERLEYSRPKVNRLMLVLLEAQLEARVCSYVELFLGGLVCKEDLIAFGVQNYDAFLHVVQNFIIADAHCFRIHEDHASLGHDDVDEEEIEYAEESK